jgi:hypothetical protein
MMQISPSDFQSSVIGDISYKEYLIEIMYFIIYKEYKPLHDHIMIITSRITNMTYTSK